jgi:pimeloyl-ACP methyl ester carboxylesterase
VPETVPVPESPRVERIIEIDGHGYSYDDVPGDPERAPLLFLHEGLGSVGLWRGFHHRLAAATGRRAVAYSRLGHGWSDPPSAPRGVNFMHVEAATTVPALRAALGLDEVILVGHSDGASIALLHAPAPGVHGAVVIAPHVFVEDIGLQAIHATRAAFTGDGLREKMARHHRDPDVTFHNWNDVWLSPEFRSWDLRPQLPAIRCPVLGIQGDADPYGTVAHVEAVRDAASGPVDLLLLQGGHAPHLEHAEQVQQAVARFVRKLG